MLAVVKCAIAGAMACGLPVEGYRTMVPVDTLRECVAVVNKTIQDLGRRPADYQVSCYRTGKK